MPIALDSESNRSRIITAVNGGPGITSTAPCGTTATTGASVGFHLSAGSVQRSWEDGLSDLDGLEPLEGRLDLEVGYSFPVFREQGALAPFAVLSLGNDDARSYRVGSSLVLGSMGALSLEAERREFASTPNHHAVMLRGILPH